MQLRAKLGGHSSYGNADINSYTNSYIDTSEKAELTASNNHIERFSKSGIPLYKSRTRLAEKQKVEE